MRIEVSGVFSSCETFATKVVRCCAARSSWPSPRNTKTPPPPSGGDEDRHEQPEQRGAQPHLRGEEIGIGEIRGDLPARQALVQLERRERPLPVEDPAVGGRQQRLGRLVEHREDALAGERVRQQSHEPLGEPGEVDEAARGAAVGGAHPEQQLQLVLHDAGQNPPAASARISLKVRCRGDEDRGLLAIPGRLSRGRARRRLAAVDCGCTLRSTGVAPSLFARSSTRLRTFSSCLNRLTASCTAWSWSAWAWAVSGAVAARPIEESVAVVPPGPAAGRLRCPLSSPGGRATCSAAGAACAAESERDAAMPISASAAAGTVCTSTARPAAAPARVPIAAMSRPRVATV